MNIKLLKFSSLDDMKAQLDPLPPETNFLFISDKGAIYIDKSGEQKTSSSSSKSQEFERKREIHHD